MAARKTTAKTELTAEELQRKNNEELREKQDAQRGLAEHYKAEKKVMVLGAPMYRAWFGNSMPIVLNGIYISVPLDGMQYEIPESFAEIFYTRIRSINEDLAIQNKLGDTVANFESFPGELDLVRPV